MIKASSYLSTYKEIFDFINSRKLKMGEFSVFPVYMNTTTGAISNIVFYESDEIDMSTVSVETKNESTKEHKTTDTPPVGMNFDRIKSYDDISGFPTI